MTLLRVVSFNANGIRSATEKGFWGWFDAQNADALCVQELKAQEVDLTETITSRSGYRSWFHCAKKRGYSGCGLWLKQTPKHVQIGFGNAEFDAEGRYIRADFARLSIVSVYFPSGTSGDDRQEAKYRFLDAILEHLETLKCSGREILVCGDFNIAHKEIDIKNWKGNLRHTGFLPQERAWVSRCLDEFGWHDVFRELDPRPGRYTWWSQRGQARAKNVGWRIDYQWATESLAKSASATEIYSTPRFSDHAPLVVDYQGEWLT